MKDSVYLVFTSRGVARMTKGYPSLNAHEFACKVKVSVPQEFFDRIAPVVEVEFPEGFIVAPKVDLSLEGDPG